MHRFSQLTQVQTRRVIIVLPYRHTTNLKNVHNIITIKHIFPPLLRKHHKLTKSVPSYERHATDFQPPTSHPHLPPPTNTVQVYPLPTTHHAINVAESRPQIHLSESTAKTQNYDLTNHHGSPIYIPFTTSRQNQPIYSMFITIQTKKPFCCYCM